MTDKKFILNKITALSLILFVGLFFACQTSTSPEEPGVEPPEIPDGERAMVIDVTDRDGVSLTGYNIEITGPTSVTASNVGESSFRFDDLESGDYTVLITRDDYLNARLSIQVELPGDRTEEYFIQDIASLAKKAPPVLIRNDEESSVETDSSDEGAAEDEKMVMSIPANSFPANVQDADGNVQVRVSRAAPSQFTQGSGGGVVSDEIIMEPAGVTLNQPVKITIPINATPGVQYVLQPGNIPLTQISGKRAASVSSASQRTVETFEVTITEWTDYTVEADVEVNLTRSTASINLDPSACGVNHTFSFSTPIIIAEDGSNDIPVEARKVLKVYQNNYGGGKELRVPTRQLTNDDSSYRFTATVITSFIEYEVRSGNVNETFIRNHSATMTTRSAECHNSGG